MWGYKVPVSSVAKITLTANDGRQLICEAAKTDSDNAERKLIYEDGTREAFTVENLREWLQRNKIPLPSWSRHGELGELYFAIFAATGGISTDQPTYYLLKSAE